MERRSFLKRMTAGVAALTLAPRAAIAKVVAPERTISVVGNSMTVGGRPLVYQAEFLSDTGGFVVDFPEGVVVRRFGVRLSTPEARPRVSLFWIEA